MNVLSLFDGMSCGQIALNKVGVEYNQYFASEIDKYAIIVTQNNYPNTIQLGDVTQVKKSNLPKIDLLIGGSPCQGFSFAGKQLNFDDPRSKLFFEYVKLLEELKPKYFLLENVKMKKEYQDVISEYLGVKPVLINSNLVTAQNRERLYWTNIISNIEQPEDRGLLISDIKEKCPDINHRDISNISKYDTKNYVQFDPMNKGNASHDSRVYFDNRKFACLRAAGNINYLHCECGKIRRCTPIEWERLQNVPENYTNHVSNTQRYKMLGNGWTVDVVTHIFKELNK